MTSLAELQAERERIRAENLKDECDAAYAGTVGQAELMTSALAVRQVLLGLPEQALEVFLDAIRGEHDETRVHYRLSDALHGLLSHGAEQCAHAASALPVVGERLKRGLKPRELLGVARWADRFRELKSGTNAPGRWHTDLTPYLAEVMDSLSEHSEVRQVTFMKSAGVGATEAMYNWIGYVMHHLGNKDLLVVVPTLELRDRSFNPRLSKMIDETPVLAELVSKATRHKSNRGDLLEYGARARIIKAGANSPDSLRSDHLPYVICDEVDAFPWDVGGEGDPMSLIENRQRTFSRAKTYLVSTPTQAGQSRIELQYQRSDRRRYHVPCPHCGEYQHLEFGGRERGYGLKWRTVTNAAHELGPKQVVDAWYQCLHCLQRIDEAHKTAMLAAGRWVAERPFVTHHRGYHLNALYAPVGLGLNWKQIAQKWLEAQDDTAELKSFINTSLGQSYAEQGDSIDDLNLLARLEAFPPGLSGLRTLGVDVQKDRLECTVVLWRAGEEAWVLDHVILPGDTAQPQVWADLTALVEEEQVRFAAIDSGFNTGMVYDYCNARQWAFAVKGVTGRGRPLVEDERKRRQRLRHRSKKAMPIEPLGVDQGKSLLYSRLKLTQPGPGFVHFQQVPAFDDEYFNQLAAEKLVTKMRGGRPLQEWVQTRPRNEALDCLIYALAALRLCGQAPGAATTTKITLTDWKRA